MLPRPKNTGEKTRLKVYISAGRVSIEAVVIMGLANHTESASKSVYGTTEQVK